MPSDCIAFKDTGYFSTLICDYLDKKPELSPFYNRFPEIEAFKEQIDEKSRNYLEANRAILSRILKKQYANTRTSATTAGNIEALAEPNTYTVTTGHQLNLFTGPLYFLYKIISTINLTEQLKATYADYNFVPVYWMATEDHDFEEIDYFNFKGKKVHWNAEAGGAVGELPTEGLDEVYKIFSAELGQGENANKLRALFENAYLRHNTLSEATRYLANELFATYGLVIIDANEAELKRLFLPYIKQDLVEHLSHNSVMASNSDLGTDYGIQVNPREINLFYLSENRRDRIVRRNGGYGLFDNGLHWTQEELLTHCEEHPERLSPNVIMRPLYQEVILPNLCYIGGGGELAYWLQLRSYFEAVKTTFPMLLLRNSVMVQSEKQKLKADKLGLTQADLFLDQQDLINGQVRQMSDIKIDFSDQKSHLQQQFKDLFSLAERTDKSFIGAVAAQEKKQIKGLERLEKRLLKAQKRKFAEHIQRITALQNELFPGRSLQERQLNFSELYLEYGDTLIEQIKAHLEPLKGEFVVLTL